MISSRKILYVGALWDGGTCRARMRALKELGLDLIEFDVSPYLRATSWVNRQLGFRLSIGPAIRRINSDLLAAARAERSQIYCVWVDKGLFLYPETLQSLKTDTSAILVHYTPDPQVTFQPEKLRNFCAAIPTYDILFTAKHFDVAAYAHYGARNVRLVHQSYDDQRLYPRIVSDHDRQRLGSEICFIGRYEKWRASSLRAIAATGARLRIWGPHWRKRLWNQMWMRDVFSGDGVWADDYSLALNATAIALCFLSKLVPETTTTRTYEIPGTGTFMLAERTDDHLSLFEEGREAEFFGNVSELVDKSRFYLENSGKRRRIAEAGYARCQRSGYGNRAQMLALWNTVCSIASIPKTLES